MNPARAGASAVAAVLGLTVLLLVLVTWAAVIGPDRVLRGPGIPAGSSLDPQASQSQTVDPLEQLRRRAHASAPATPPVWLRWLAGVVELALGAVGVLLVWRLGRYLVARWRDRRRPPERSRTTVEFDVLDAGPALAAAIDAEAGAQRARLETGEPRNAIVACWHRFETAAVRAGVRRRAWQTPSEFVLEVLDGAGADPAAVLRLADLYREARFSDHPVTEDHRRRALDELEATHLSLHAGRR